MSETPASPGGSSDNPADAVAVTDNNTAVSVSASASASASVSIKVPIPLLREDVAENAVDDSEDLPDDDFKEATQTKNYNQRHHHNRPPGTLSRAQELVPFPFLPNVRPLTISDLESCVALENAAFANPAHRGTREKFEYRLSTCPELCLGLFCTIPPDKLGNFEIDTFPPAHLVETGRKDGAKSVLMAHIVSTRSRNLFVTNKDMDYPRDFRTNKQTAIRLGHQEHGSTVCIHSFAVHPKLQGCGLGKILMKSYLQQLRNAECAQRCSLICQGDLITFYERFGFRNHGTSCHGFGGGGWHDMSLAMKELPSYSAKPRPRR